MAKVKAKDLKAGKTVYFAHGLGEHSFIQKHIIASRILVSKYTGYQYVKTKMVLASGKVVDSRFFIGDIGLNPNERYNNHRAFYKPKAAERYIQMCKELNIGQRFDDPEPFGSLSADYY